MPKYRFEGSYTDHGLKGVLQEGGSKRREAAAQLLKGMGGRLEAYYYAFGLREYQNRNRDFQSFAAAYVRP